MYIDAVVSAIDERSIWTDSKIWRLFTRASGDYVRQPDDEFNPNAWLEIPDDSQCDEVYQEPDPASVNPLFKGKRFVFAQPAPKSFWERFGPPHRFVWRLGGYFSLFVSKTTSFVVSDDENDRKAIKAHALGIPVLSWDDFILKAGEV